MTRKVLVTGAAGMLGGTLVPILREEGYEVYPTDIECSEKGIMCLDIKDVNGVMSAVKEHKPDLVIHLAAKTDVERCEVEPEDAYLVNVVGTANVAKSCKEIGSTMVYISTAGVFDGRKRGPYTELDQPNPINVYGKTKLQGEMIVSNILERYFIVRTSWLFGGGITKDKKFVGKIVRQIIEGKKVIYAVIDKFGSPTYVVDLCRAILRLMRTEYYGLYHFTCKGFVTRFDVANEILTWLGRNDIRLVPVTSDYFSKEYYAPRPDVEALESHKLQLVGISSLRYWKESLLEYLDNNFRNLRQTMDSI